MLKRCNDVTMFLIQINGLGKGAIFLTQVYAYKQNEKQECIYNASNLCMKLQYFTNFCIKTKKTKH